jgi:hypothetical protein
LDAGWSVHGEGLQRGQRRGADGDGYGVAGRLGPTTAYPRRRRTVYIVEGTVRYHIADETFDAGPGDIIYIPAGTVENFEPTSKSRVIITYTPGGMDKYFLEVGEPAPDAGLPPAPEGPPSPEFLERMATVGTRYGLDMKL